MIKSGYQILKIKRLIYDIIPFREKFIMKSEDTLDWYPAQLPPVKIILGEAVLAETLGLSSGEIARLIDSGIVGTN